MPIKTKIGLYAGTFDPVHEGHVAFIENAIQTVGLDKVYCMPDKKPRWKTSVTDHSHRKAMMELALADISQAEVYETKTDSAAFPETIDELGLQAASVYLMIGSDAALNLRQWRNSRSIIQQMHFIVGMRDAEDSGQVEAMFRSLGVSEDRFTLIMTGASGASSSQARIDIAQAHPDIADYIRKHDLYT